jgi:class 3 adenylate cyclase
MGVHESLIDGCEGHNDKIKSRYSGVPINSNYCPIYIDIYPSKVMEDRFLTWRPTIYALASILIFIFTSIIFIVYDRKVERRQQIVLTSAEQNNAVVSSLFPSSVRDRIICGANKINNNDNIITSACIENIQSKNRNEETETTEIIDIESSIGGTCTRNTNTRHNHDWWSTKLTSHNSRRDSGGSSSHFSTTTALTTNSLVSNPVIIPFSTIPTSVSPPIAELYPETTILFADIVGFTYWSSFHTPTDVFTLLETLYHEFDQCARSRHVFKVETIGDCYVAAVGLPKALPTNQKRNNHAVIMSRFAYDIIQKTDTVMLGLSLLLGEETCYLSIRVGINSGPTTAGVLRGDKSRFQIFGDTVNTAARMESNGSSRKIHCSQSTATLLENAGKNNWLTKREDKIIAKGKGLMQTYWVQPAATAPEETTTTANCESLSTSDNIAV